MTRDRRASRAWKARPIPSSWPDATPMAQVGRTVDGPLLTVRDRQLPVLRARRGHGRRGPTALRRGGDGHKLNRRVRPVVGDHCLVGKPPRAARQELAMATAHPRDQADQEHQAGGKYANQQGQCVTRGESNHVSPGVWRSQMHLCPGWPWSIGGPGRRPAARPQESRGE
jgi:hypothetical protein